jgi:Polyketide cyclase / dehydrase and lipid transport
VLRMTDGSQISEQLVDYDAQRGWTNELTGFTNVVRHLLALVEDDWRFTEDADGTRVTWTWTFHPVPTAVGKLATRGVIAPLHRPYLQRILDKDLAEALDARLTSRV